MEKTKKVLLCLTTVALLTACNGGNNSTSNSTTSNDSNSTTSSESNSVTNSESNSPSYDSSSSSSSSSVASKTIRVHMAERPESFIEFDNNQSGKTDNEEDKFMELNKDYLVGDDNSVDFKPEMTFIEIGESGIPSETYVDSWNFDITVTNKDTNDKTNIDQYVDSIDKINCLIDFSDKAIDKKFNIKVIPEGLTDSQKERIDDYTNSYDVKVIDGYNIYDAKELAYLHNNEGKLDDRTNIVHDYEQKAVWDAFKDENNLKKDFNPSTLIFQKDIQLKSDDIPSAYMFAEDEVSPKDKDYDKALHSLKDWNNIYFRRLADNETLNIYGNYFMLDARKMPYVVRDGMQVLGEGATLNSHATLFRFENKENCHGQVNLSDINFVGNSGRSEDTKLSGGLIMNKTEGPTFTATNNITKAWFITWMPNYSDAPYVMNKCKSYNNFSCFVYNWGSSDVTILNSDFVGAGGPIIIQDHVGHDANGEGGKIPHTKILDSHVESNVAGTEGWFNIVGATGVVGQIKELNNLFTPFQRTFLNASSESSEKLFNFICVNKSGENEGVTKTKIQGNLSIGSSTNAYKFDYGKSNPYVSGILASTWELGAPVLETNAGGYSYTDAKTGLFDEKQSQIVDPNNNMYKGDVLCLYYNGMAVVMGYGPLQNNN